jgi:membrane dipeptidase
MEKKKELSLLDDYSFQRTVAAECAQKELNATEDQIEKGLQLHKKALVVDCFCLLHNFYFKEMDHVQNEMIDEGYAASEIAEGRKKVKFHEMLKNKEARSLFCKIMTDAGVTSIAPPCGGGLDIENMIRALSYNQCFLDAMSPFITKALCANDIIEAKKAERYTMLFGVNTPPHLGNLQNRTKELEWLDIFHRLGVRMMHLTYNRQTLIGSGCACRHDGGLSDFGEDIVKKMNETGIIVDVPHSSRQTVLDACKISNKPVLSSHTMCRSLYDHPRGRTDEEIKAIADTNGLVGIVAYSAFLSEGIGTLNNLLNHIDHVVKLVGVNHVGIGTDNRFQSAPINNNELKKRPKTPTGEEATWWGNSKRIRTNDPTGFRETRNGSLSWLNWPYLTVGLLSRGYSDEDVQKIVGLNFIRLFKDCCG